MNLLPAIELETKENPDASVIWLHGLGADGGRILVARVVVGHVDQVARRGAQRVGRGRCRRRRR